MARTIRPCLNAYFTASGRSSVPSWWDAFKKTWVIGIEENDFRI
jgi:hypothetical protein